VLVPRSRVQGGSFPEADIGIVVAMVSLTRSGQAVKGHCPPEHEHPAPSLRERSAVTDSFIAAGRGIQNVNVVSRRPALERGAERVRHLLVDRRARRDGLSILRGEMIGPGLDRLVYYRKADCMQDEQPVPVRLPAAGIRVASGLSGWVVDKLGRPVAESTQVGVGQLAKLGAECFLSRLGRHAHKPVEQHFSPDFRTQIMLSLKPSLV
jgi:hypothetical protein